MRMRPAILIACALLVTECFAQGYQYRVNITQSQTSQNTVEVAEWQFMNGDSVYFVPDYVYVYYKDGTVDPYSCYINDDDSSTVFKATSLPISVVFSARFPETYLAYDKVLITTPSKTTTMDNSPMTWYMEYRTGYAGSWNVVFSGGRVKADISANRYEVPFSTKIFCHGSYAADSSLSNTSCSYDHEVGDACIKSCSGDDDDIHKTCTSTGSWTGGNSFDCSGLGKNTSAGGSLLGLLVFIPCFICCGLAVVFYQIRKKNREKSQRVAPNPNLPQGPQSVPSAQAERQASLAMAERAAQASYSNGQQPPNYYADPNAPPAYSVTPAQYAAAPAQQVYVSQPTTYSNAPLGPGPSASTYPGNVYIAPAPAPVAVATHHPQTYPPGTPGTYPGQPMPTYAPGTPGTYPGQYPVQSSTPVQATYANPPPQPVAPVYAAPVVGGPVMGAPMGGPPAGHSAYSMQPPPPQHEPMPPMKAANRFCVSCGSQLAPGIAVCSICGSPA